MKRLLPFRVATLLALSALAIAPGASAQAQSEAPATGSVVVPATGVLKGVIKSKQTKEPLGQVSVMLPAVKMATLTNEKGEFTFTKLPAGTYEVKSALLGYIAKVQTIEVTSTGITSLNFTLDESPINLSTVEVIGEVTSVAKIPGSGEVLTSEIITKNNPIGVELLRKVSGVNVRDEDGVGLRPNIGVRGIIPTRSGKVLLLEDGVPFVQSPYGDSQTYYHPQVSRMQRVEVLKGSGEIIYGPQTMGGVINYITPQPGAKQPFQANVMGGNQEFFRSDLGYSKMWRSVGTVINYTHLQSNLTRENAHTQVDEVVGKFIWRPDATSRFTAKGGFFNELSQQTYAHLTQIEFEENPYGNMFVHDTMRAHRWSTHLIYEKNLGERGALATNLYAYTFKRHWWRQGSNGGANATAPVDTVGTRTIPSPNRSDGKNRRFYVVGLEPRVRLSRNTFGTNNEFDFGVRAHYEIQDRVQVLASSPIYRYEVGLLENDFRQALALSAFVQDKITLNEQWNASLGLRLENVHYKREAGVTLTHPFVANGADKLTDLIPGMGLTYAPTPHVAFFGGVHRGYGPPQVQDLISGTGGLVDLPSELSWNYELGARAMALRGVDMHLTGFFMNFENQIIPQSGAGGSGTQYTTARQSAHGGAEFSGTARLNELTGTRTNLSVDVAYTWLPLADFTQDQTSSWNKNINVKGNRLTYAPEQMVTAGLKWQATPGASLRGEVVYLGQQFSDDLNTIAPSPNGRQGILPAQTTLNADANVDIGHGLLLTASGKNLADKVNIQDRSRGILVGPGRRVYVGVQSHF
jgi:Fe(3+) dicitrate transport protein